MLFLGHKTENEGGYVLVLTLVSLVVLSLGMSIAAEQISTSQLRQIELRKARNFAVDAYSVENELGYALTKEYYSRVAELGRASSSRGTSLRQTKEEYVEPFLEALDKNYIWHDALLGVEFDREGISAEVHNRRSMIDLNSKSETYMLFWASRLGAENARSLVDTLFDYTDEDDFNRVRGAEQADYEETGLTIPNRQLFHPAEICRVLLWQDLEVCSDPLKMARLFYVGDGEWMRMRVASDYMKKFALADRYTDAGVGAQIIEWENLAQTNGFFEYDLVGGESGSEYVVILKSGKNDGFLRRLELEIMPIGSSRPVEVLSHWETSFNNF